MSIVLPALFIHLTFSLFYNDIYIDYICPLFYLHYLYISPLVFYINDVSILIHLYMSIVLPALFIHLTFSLFYK